MHFTLIKTNKHEKYLAFSQVWVGGGGNRDPGWEWEDVVHLNALCWENGKGRGRKWR